MYLAFLFGYHWSWISRITPQTGFIFSDLRPLQLSNLCCWSRISARCHYRNSWDWRICRGWTPWAGTSSVSDRCPWVLTIIRSTEWGGDGDGDDNGEKYYPEQAYCSFILVVGVYPQKSIHKGRRYVGGGSLENEITPFCCCVFYCWLSSAWMVDLSCITQLALLSDLTL